MSTDKEAGGMFPAYRRIAADLGPAARVLELGVFQGESLSLWQVLFPEGEVTGVDCNPDAVWPEGTRRMVMRQEDPELPAVLKEAGVAPLDLIVDDCSHQGDLTRASLGLLWPLLAPGGFYVIEDWMIGLPAFEWHWMHDPGMLTAVRDLLLLLDRQDADVDEITYRYGMCIVHKRATG